MKPRHLPKKNNSVRDLRNYRLMPKDPFIVMLERDENEVRKQIELKETKWD
jgi:hypothetical protein